MFIHFYLVDVRHFQNYIAVYFLTLFGAPIDSRLVCLKIAPESVMLSNSGRYCSYKLQDRKGYRLTKTSLISGISYLN